MQYKNVIYNQYKMIQINKQLKLRKTLLTNTQTQNVIVQLSSELVTELYTEFVFCKICSVTCGMQ